MFSPWVLLTSGVIKVSSSGSDIYNDIKDRSEKTFEETMKAMLSDEPSNGEFNLDSMEGIVKWFWTKFYELYVIIKGLFPLAIGLSIVMGILILVIVQKNKVIRKFAIVGFFVSIPLILILIVYVIPALAPVFTG